MMSTQQQYFIDEKSTIREALVKLNDLIETPYRTLFVINSSNVLLGTLTDGDIRRGLINGCDVTDVASKVMNVNYKFIASNNIDPEQMKTLREKRIFLVPLLDEQKRVIRLIDLSKQKTILPVDAVIMAGGKGERLRPLTEQVPKPMLQVGEKPILEHNINRFTYYGIHHLSITLGYLPEVIQNYFKDGSSWDCHINYIKEEKPLGTIGSLALIDDFKNDTVLLMNSDLLTNIDFEEFYHQFKKEDATISVASIPYSVTIPYAVLEQDNLQITSLAEKPTYTYYSNAGIYLIKKSALERIPKNEFYNATDLIELMIQENKKVITFPILGYWLDIGRHEDYKKAQEDIKHLHLFA